MEVRALAVAALIAAVAPAAAPAAAASPGAAAAASPPPAVAASPDLTAGTAAVQGCTFPFSAVDATGTEVTVEGEPSRVVTLAPSAAQTMWEIGARGKVVGLTKYASYLEGADERTVVSGDGQIVVFEEVVALEPDLVLAPNAVSNETVERLRDAGLTVYYFPPTETIEDVYAKVELIGRLTGECEGAEETVAWMRERVDTVREAVEGEERPDVLYLFFGYTAGEGTFIHEIIETAGGNNLAADVGITWYQKLSREVVIDRDPDWIVLNSNDPAIPRTTAFNVTTAVRRGQTVVIPIEHLNQPGPRVVYAITTLAEHFHPEAYARANATATPTASPEPRTSASPTPTPDVSSPTVGGDTPATTPGFGPLAALLAVLVALLAARPWR